MVSDWYRIETKKAGIAHHYGSVAVCAVAVRAIRGRGSCGLRRGSCNLRLRFVQFAVRAVFSRTDHRKPWRRVPTFPDYNGYHTLSNYKIYISILYL
jgi:hypothetical protein